MYKVDATSDEDHPPEPALSEAEWVTVDKIPDYLQGRVAQAELVEWSPREAVRHGLQPHGERGVRVSQLLADIIRRLGLPEPALSEAERVAEFGLRCRAVAGATFTEGGAERERTRLGNPGNRDSREIISDCEEFLRRLEYRATVTVSGA